MMQVRRCSLWAPPRTTPPTQSSPGGDACVCVVHVMRRTLVVRLRSHRCRQLLGPRVGPGHRIAERLASLAVPDHLWKPASVESTMRRRYITMRQRHGTNRTVASRCVAIPIETCSRNLVTADRPKVLQSARSSEQRDVHRTARHCGDGVGGSGRCGERRRCRKRAGGGGGQVGQVDVEVITISLARCPSDGSLATAAAITVLALATISFGSCSDQPVWLVETDALMSMRERGETCGMGTKGLARQGEIKSLLLGRSCVTS